MRGTSRRECALAHTSAAGSRAAWSALLLGTALLSGCIATPSPSSDVESSSSSGGSGATSSGGSGSSSSSGGTTSSSGGTPAVKVTVSPRTRSLTTAETLQLVATVTGSSNATVSWTVQEGAAGGAVSSTGLYTPPSSPGVYHVVAMSQVDRNATDVATLTVNKPGTCTDPCPAPSGGVSWECEKRFMYGLNWAWGDFGADFGGITAWNKGGVKARSSAFDADMKKMKAAGVSVIRWWMFPRFRTESIQWGSDDAPAGIGGSLVADIQEALRLADANDLYVMLTPFSFDNFKPTKDESGIVERSIRPMVVDASLRKKLLENLVKPVAHAVETSPYKKRMIAWDMINEPEWALSGNDGYGDPSFEPQPGYETVTHAQLELFLNEMATVLRASSGALVSVGGAAIKWAKAWSRVDQDFYQFHYYDWVYEWFPYETVTPASVGMNDKPVVVGEFPAAGLKAISSKSLPARTAPEYVADLWRLGYAGALSWAYNDPGFPWTADSTKPFHDQHACETAY